MKALVLLAVASLLATQTFYAQNHQSRQNESSKVAAKALAETGETLHTTRGFKSEIEVNPFNSSLATQTHTATGKDQDTPLTGSKLKLNVATLSPGKYSLHVDFLGYKTKIVDNVNIATGKEEPNVGILLMWMLFL